MRRQAGFAFGLHLNRSAVMLLRSAELGQGYRSGRRAASAMEVGVLMDVGDGRAEEIAGQLHGGDE